MGDYGANDGGGNYNPYENDNASGHGGDNLFQSTQNFGGRESQNIRDRNQERLKSLEKTYGVSNDPTVRDFHTIRPEIDIKGYDQDIYNFLK